MSTLDFPSSPTVGQVFIGNNGVAYTWNGTLWLATSSAANQGGGIIREVTLASPTNIIDLPSLGVKSCTLMFSLTGTATATAVSFQATLNGTPDAANIYYNSQINCTGTTVSFAVVGPATSHNVTSVDAPASQLSGSYTVPSIALGRMQGQIATFSSSTAYHFQQNVNFPLNCNGFKFYTPSGNFAAGSFVRVIGWP